jgi:hypothetical protein
MKDAIPVRVSAARLLNGRLIVLGTAMEQTAESSSDPLSGLNKTDHAGGLHFLCQLFSMHGD